MILDNFSLGAFHFYQTFSGVEEISRSGNWLTFSSLLKFVTKFDIC